MPVQINQGDCLDVLETLPDNSVDSIVTDPPYGLSEHSQKDVVDCLKAWINGEPFVHGKTGFCGRAWDGWVVGPEVWKECLRVLKPGSHMLCFAGTRTMDLMSIGIRLSGFELRDNIGNAHDDSNGGGAPLLAWVYGQGMSHGINVSKSILKTNGLEDDATKWEGWHSSLKPAFEPIILARKPLIGTVAENVLQYGTGALNIDECRIPIDENVDDPRLGGKGEWSTGKMAKNVYSENGYAGDTITSSAKGRFAANFIHDGSEVVEDIFSSFGVKSSGKPGVRRKPHQTNSMSGTLAITGETETGYADKGSASRFFYCSKASPKDRQGSKHVSIKPIKLMRYLVKLVTPKNGVVLDPFAGSGTTGQAAIEEGFNAILIEREPEHVQDCVNRIGMFQDGVTKVF